MAVINTNSLALGSQNNLKNSEISLNNAIQRLSSGQRINSAKDDAAGQAIANRLTAQIRGMTQAARNANDGISMAQTAESRIQDEDYATEVSNMARAQILQQAGTSVLAQANQVPQAVQSLLR